MRLGLKFYKDMNNTTINQKLFNEEKKVVDGKAIFFVERREHSGKYVVFFETKDGYEYHPFDNVNGLASGQKAKTFEACCSKAHTMGLFENDTPVMKKFEAPCGVLNTDVKFKESRKKLYERIFRENTENLPSWLEATICDFIDENWEEDEYVPFDDIYDYAMECAEEAEGDEGDEIDNLKDVSTAVKKYIKDIAGDRLI